MNNLKLFFRASTPLFILLFLRFTGTTKAEYEANFRKISGPVKGPFIILFENFDLITNDSLKGGDNAFSKFQSLMYRHDLNSAYRNFSKEVKTHNMSWGTHAIDTLFELPDEPAWDQLVAKEEGFVYERDTVFYSEYRYPIDIPVKLGVFRSISARVFFSLGDNKNLLQVIFPDDEEKEDPYKLRKRIKMSVKGTASGTYEGLSEYYQQLQAFVEPHTVLTAKRLNTSAVNGRAYKIWDENDELIFDDEEGLEGLEYKTNATGMIDVLSDEGDGRFILWYDYWYVYFLIVLQVMLYLGVWSEFSAPAIQKTKNGDE